MRSLFSFVVVTTLLTFSSATSGGKNHNNNNNKDNKWRHDKNHGGHHIDFSHCPPPPKTSDKLPILTLGKAVEFPWGAVKDIVLATAKSKKEIKEVDIGNGTVLISDDRVAARLDKATGETTVFPRLDALKAGSRFSLHAAKKYFQQKAIFPPDATKFTLVQGERVFNAVIDRTGNETKIVKPEAFLSTFFVQRNVSVGGGQYTIRGPGTKGSFSVDSSGNVVSISHRWRSAKDKGSKLKPLPQNSIQDAILAQLGKANVTNATVDDLELCYYDSGNSHIQPVYRFLATPNNTLPGIEVQQIVGYVSAVEGNPDKLPDLIGPDPVSDPAPAALRADSSTPSKFKRQGSNSVGFVRYLMQNDGNVPLWLQDSQEFLNGLKLGSAVANILCILGHKFCGGVNSEQYYWSESRLFTNENDFFVDSAPLAYQENHGSPHHFCTDGNAANCGDVSLADIPKSGYGDGQTHLRYWINRACSFIPGPSDMDIATAAAPWWDVFDGLHAALGFRVSSYCRDGTTFPIGMNAALGTGMVSSWMHTVNNIKQYQGLAHGAASAIAVCGHSDDTLYDRANLGPANCLTFWYVA